MPQTLYDIASGIRELGPTGKAGKSSPPITGGLKPRKFDVTPGLRELTPEELLNLRIQRLTVTENGSRQIVGYQRPEQIAHIRKISRALAAGREMPPLLVSVDRRGTPWITDGQHRALAAIAAGVPIHAVIQERDKDAAALLFSDQRYAIRPNPALAILTGSDDFDCYIQDALTRDDHPWSGLIGVEPFPKHKMGPQTAKMMLTSYVANTVAVGTGKMRLSEIGFERFDEAVADELAGLVACFGTKDTNPVAFKPRSLRAIGTVVTLAVRRSDQHATDAKRWKSWMPQFPFNAYAHINSSVGLADVLIGHWNKRLHVDRRISR